MKDFRSKRFENEIAWSHEQTKPERLDESTKH